MTRIGWPPYIAGMKHITQEQFNNIKPGDGLVYRTDLEAGKRYGRILWLDGMAKSSRVIRNCDDKSVEIADHWFVSKEMIAEVIPASEEPKDNEPWTEVTYFMTVEGPNGMKVDRATTFGKESEIPTLSEWAKEMRGGKGYIIVDVKILTLQR